MNLYLIRHGQTDWNIDGKLQGRTDIPLNETGVKQAGYLAEGMKKRPVTQVFSSFLTRARQTAQAVADSQQVPVIITDGLEEVSFGVWEGLTWKEVRETKLPEEMRERFLNPTEFRPEGGELPDEVMARCAVAMRSIMSQMKKCGGDAAIVSHGAMLIYLIAYLLGEDPAGADIVVGNASITTIQYDEERGLFSLVQMNDQRHLNRICEIDRKKMM